MTLMGIFLCGAGGSLAIDIFKLASVLEFERPTLPKRYRTTLYYIIRLIVALIGGGLALAYEVEQPLLAINIGASAPLILEAYSKGLDGIK